jgi:hypothetical protein
MLEWPSDTRHASANIWGASWNFLGIHLRTDLSSRRTVAVILD